MTFQKAFMRLSAVLVFSLFAPLLASGPASADSGQQIAQSSKGSNPFRNPDCLKDPGDAMCPGPTPTVAGVPVPGSKALGLNAKDTNGISGAPPPASHLLYRELVNSILIIQAGSPDSNVASQGSAVVIANDLAITNCHVVMRPVAGLEVPYPIIMAASEKASPVNAKVVEAHPEFDICVLKFGVLRTSPISSIGLSSGLLVGETIYTLGNPLGLAFTWAPGSISALRPETEFRRGYPIDAIQFTAPTSHGSSGGALFDEYGRWIGITNSGIDKDSAQNLNFAIAADEVWRKFGKCPKPGQKVRVATFPVYEHLECWPK